MQTVDEARWRILELSITAELPTEMQIHCLASGVRSAREETTGVQLELNLYIVELRMKVQPSTPSEVKEQRVSMIQTGVEEIGRAVQDYTGMLDQAFDILTSLQEDPNIQRLETEAHKLQEQYDSVRGIV